jgi:hypothetical protein
MSTDMLMSAREIAGALMERLGKRDPASLAALFAPNIDWHIPGDQAVAPWVGSRRTHSRLRLQRRRSPPSRQRTRMSGRQFQSVKGMPT